MKDKSLIHLEDEIFCRTYCGLQATDFTTLCTSEVRAATCPQCIEALNEEIGRAEVTFCIGEDTPISPGRKDDADDGTGTGSPKLRYDLIFNGKIGLALEEVVRALMWGAKEYGEQNWEKVERHRPRYFAAACRHLFSWYRGESWAKDSGCHHLACAISSLLFLIAREDESV